MKTKLLFSRTLLFVGFLLLTAACTQNTTPPRISTPTGTSKQITTGIPSQIGGPTTAQTSLEQRPLHLPTLAPRTACPAAHGHPIDPAFGLALGNGPVYPVGLGANGILMSSNFFQDGTDWGGGKVLWVIKPGYHAPILVRGHQIDGSHTILFNRDRSPEMYFSNYYGEPWANIPTYTRVQTPGCYAYQVDGAAFSEVIIFQVIQAHEN